MYGGLSSAWGRSYSYFQNVYAELNSLGATGANRPFDYFAIHPYPDYQAEDAPPASYDIDPDIYLYAVGILPHTTIVDKFMETMAAPGNDDGNKKAWITEIGWNSAKGGSVECWEPLTVNQNQQAQFLKRSFDTLFDDVTLWGQTTKAVEKIIWYQYRDIGVDEDEVCDEAGAAAIVQTLWENRISAGYIPKSQDEMAAQEGVLDWHFGLYQGDKTTSKPAQCVFAAYPNEAQCLNTFLPVIFKNHP